MGSRNTFACSCEQRRRKTCVPAGGWGAGRSGHGTWSGQGAEPPFADPCSQPKFSYSCGTAIRAQRVPTSGASLHGLAAPRLSQHCPPLLPPHRARPGLGADGCSSTSFSNVPPAQPPRSCRFWLVTISPCLGTVSTPLHRITLGAADPHFVERRIIPCHDHGYVREMTTVPSPARSYLDRNRFPKKHICLIAVFISPPKAFCHLLCSKLRVRDFSGGQLFITCLHSL